MSREAPVVTSAHLAEFVFGTLPPGESASVQAELEATPALAREVGRLTEALVASLAPQLVPIAPRPEIRARLLATIAGSP